MIRRLLIHLLWTIVVGFPVWGIPVSSYAAPISYKQDGFELTLKENRPASALLQLSIGKGTVRSFFTIDAPSRFVVDLSGVKLGQNRALKPSGSGLVSAVRIGVHDEILRIVVDCKGETPPRFKVSEGPGTVTVTLDANAADMEDDGPHSSSSEANATVSSEESSAAPDPSSAASQVQSSMIAESSSVSAGQSSSVQGPVPTTPPEATATPAATRTPEQTRTPSPTNTAKATSTPKFTVTPKSTPTPRPTKTPKPTLTPKPTRTPKAEATAVPPTTAPSPAAAQSSVAPIPPTEVPSPTAVVIGPAVSGIQFDYTGERTPTLKIKLNERREFKMTKTDDRSYDIQLTGYSVAAPHIALPQFPPDDFVGFTFVRAYSEDGVLHIIVGVDRGVRITSVNRDNEIWVKTQS